MERLEADAPTVFDAGYQAGARFAKLSWRDDSKPVTVRADALCGGSGQPRLSRNGTAGKAGTDGRSPGPAPLKNYVAPQAGFNSSGTRTEAHFMGPHYWDSFASGMITLQAPVNFRRHLKC